VLLGRPGEEIKTSVKITPEDKYPFKIVEVTAEKGKNIRYRLEGSETAGYLLAVENVKRGKGRYFDAIYLKTTSEIGPVIKILVWGNIK